LLIALAFISTGCSSDEEKKASHLEKGKTYFENGEYKSAELEFRNAIQIDPEFVDAYERLGETYLKLGDPRGAFREYSMVAKLDPENIDASLKLATFYMLGKKTAESREKVEAVLAKEPNNIEALFLMAGSMTWKKTCMKRPPSLKRFWNWTVRRPVLTWGWPGYTPVRANSMKPNPS
jgi:Tfp pilus assembly protein PilF